MLIFISILAVFAGGLIQSAFGFGFVIFSLPIISFFMPPKVAVPVLLTLATLNTLIVALKSFEDIQLKRIWPLIPAGIIGIPLGTLILLRADSGFIKVLIGATILVFVLALVEFHRPVKRERAGMAIAGFASGILQGSVGMSGPPIILYFSNQEVSKKPFRANLIFYFLILNIITLFSYALAGIYTKQVLSYTAILLPALILGTVSGIFLFKKVNEKLFKKLIIVFLIIMAVITIISGLRII